MADSAREIIASILAQYGLHTALAEDGRPLVDWAWERYLEVGDANVVMIELRAQPAFKNRFPAYDELAKQGRALSPAEYVAYEQSFYNLLQQYGVPDGVFGPEKVTELLLNDVSASELSERLALNATAMFTAPQEVRDALRTMYGVDEGSLLAYWLDPDAALPKLQQRMTSAQIAAAAAERNFGMVRSEAERFASLGYGWEDARQAAEEAAAVRGLSVGTNRVGERDVLFAGLGDESAQRRVRRAISSRLARNLSGGRAVEERSGVSGLADSSLT